MDIMYTKNYNMGFPTTRTDSLLRITHWQYWWWFWFTYFLVLYYFLILRLFRFRVLKFKPKLATTTRSHGKWGDLIVCLLPISWCTNILTNSNLILRMLEWQSESSLFTVRVRGKQWYWVYKFELKTITDILTVPKNIGHNKWFISMFNDIKTADDYLHIIQLRSQNNWVNSYWSSIFERYVKDPSFYISSPQELLYVDYLNTKNFLNKSKLINQNLNRLPNFLKKNENFNELSIQSFSNVLNFNLKEDFKKNINNSINDSTFFSNLDITYLKKSNKSLKSNNLDSIEFDSKLIILNPNQEFSDNGKNFNFKNFNLIFEEDFVFDNSYDLNNLTLNSNFLKNIKTIELKIPTIGVEGDLTKTNPNYTDFLENVIQLKINSKKLAKKLVKNQIEYKAIFDKLIVNPNNSSLFNINNNRSDSEVFENFFLKNFYTILGAVNNSSYKKYPSSWYVKFLSNKIISLQPEIRQENLFYHNFLNKSTYFNRYEFNSIFFKHFDYPINSILLDKPKNNLIKFVSIENTNNLKNTSSFFSKSPSNLNLKQDLQNFSSYFDFTNVFNNFFKDFNFSNFFNSDLPEIHRWVKPTDEIKLPIRLIKNPLKYTNFNELDQINKNKFKLFRLKFNEDSDVLQNKPLPLSSYLIYKQKRYTRRDKFKGVNKNLIPLLNQDNILKNNNNNNENSFNLQYNIYSKFFESAIKFTKTRSEYLNLINIKSPLFNNLFKLNHSELESNIPVVDSRADDIKNKFNPYLVGNQLVVDNIDEVLQNYKSIKHSKNTSEDVPNIFNRRLLRTKRTLVLPAHVNITIITNSYDVIHSWFIPGLGLKLDCIPGRATHHMLHIDNVGFYYGQCAEICGRYHHHMPIRICALPFEHFLVWWHTFGLPKMLQLNNSKKKNYTIYSSKKYTW